MSKAKEATSAGPPRKPLIFAENPFDSATIDDIEFMDVNWDASYVPGYSELKRQNEIRRSKGQKPVEIPRLQWVRIARPGGGDVSASDEAMVNWMKLGYRACGLDDLEDRGFKVPPTAHIAPDGTIRRGDLALFIVGSDRANLNRKRDAQRRGQKVDEPRTGTGAVYGVEGERTDFKGSLKEISEIELPNLSGGN